jgi:uncharacterized membrane protein YqiK
VATAFITVRFRRQLRLGQALVVHAGAEPRVFFTSRVVLPLHRAETLDLSPRRVVVELSGRKGLVCRDRIRVDVRVIFLVGVEARVEAVRRVARELGCARANHPPTVGELFEARFAEVLSTVAWRHTFEELRTRPALLAEEVRRELTADLDGFLLRRVAVERLEQTPLEQLDPNNLLDAEGIRVLTERTLALARETQELKYQDALARVRAELAISEERLALERARTALEAARTQVAETNTN